MFLRLSLKHLSQSFKIAGDHCKVEHLEVEYIEWQQKQVLIRTIKTARLLCQRELNQIHQ